MRRLLTAIGLLVLPVLVIVCNSDVADVPAPDNPTAPYFTSLDEAMATNDDGRHVLVDFYTDW